MKNEFSPARFASCPKDASYCVSNASFFISQKTFIPPLDKSQIRAIIIKSLRHNRISGGVPEWPKGTDCKSAAFRFDGSNPSSPTTKQLIHFGISCFVLRRGKDSNNEMQQSGGLLLDAGSTASTP